MKETMLMYKGYTTYFKRSGITYNGKIEDIDDLVTFMGNSRNEFEEAFHRAVDDYLETCMQVGKKPCAPVTKDIDQVIGEKGKFFSEKIIIGHNFGGAVWIRTVFVDCCEKIDHKTVHEIGEEVSIEKDFFDEEFKDIFVRNFEPELLVNKNRFTRAFSDEGQFLSGFQSDILEPNFYTRASIERIIDEIEVRGGEYDHELSGLLRDMINEAPEDGYISVMS